MLKYIAVPKVGIIVTGIIDDETPSCVQVSTIQLK